MAFGIFLLYGRDANDAADFTLASHVGSQDTQQALMRRADRFWSLHVNLGQRQKTPGLIEITRSPRQTVRRQPERKILALAVDGSELGRRGHAGSRQGL
jgi:hypothetical protein